MLGADDFLIVSLPILAMAVLVAAMARIRPIGRILALGIGAAYSVLFIAVTFFPIPVDARYIIHLREIGVHPVHNLVPGSTIASTFALGADIFTYQVGGNILLTAPLGFLVPVLWSRRESFKSTLWIGLAVALGVELAQFVVSGVLGVRYKSLDVDDLLLNTVGVVVGWLAWYVMKPRGSKRGDWHAALDWLRGGDSLTMHNART